MKVIAYQIEIDGVRTAITNQNELAEAVKQTTAEYKKSDFGSEKFKQSEKELAQLRTLQAKFRQDVKDTAREQQIAADKGRGSYRALNSELVNLRRRYKELSAAERETVGPDLLNRIQKLDKELKSIDASMGQYQRNVGNYADAFSQLGGLDLAALATVPGAVVAVSSAAIDAGQYVFELTENFRRLRGEVQNLTGATGDDLDLFTTRIAAIAETFDQSESEILNAANSVSQQLGISFDEAFTRIEEGFIAGSNQTGEFLDNLREYPAFFQEAGLTADQFFRIINQQATQGLYSDKGVDTVKEVTLRLRENTTATQKALEGIGLSSEEVRQKIEQEGIGAAIATVADRLSQLEADSPEVGAALADIFGGPGEDAGLKFITSLRNINEETSSLIDATNEYQQQQQRTLEVNRQFAEVQNDIAKELGGTTASFSDLGTQIKTGALQVVLFLVQRFKELLSIFSPVGDALTSLGRSLGLFNENGERTERLTRLISAALDLAQVPAKLFAAGLTAIVDGLTGAVNAGRRFIEWLGLASPETEKLEGNVKGMAGSMGRLGGSVKRTTKEQEAQLKVTEESKKRLDDLTRSTNAAAVATDQFAKGSIAELQEKVSDLRAELERAAPNDVEGILVKLLAAEKALEDLENFRTTLRNELASTRQEIKPIEPLPDIDQTAVKTREQTGIIEREFAETTDRIADRQLSKQDEVIAATIEKQQQLAATIREIQSGIFSGIGDVLEGLGEASQAKADSEIAALEERYSREIELAEGNNRQQKQLEDELEQKKRQIQQRELEEQKKFRKAAALASLAEGIVNILSAPTTIPDPFGVLFKAARIEVLRLTTQRQIAAIDTQQAAKGAVIELARGGILRGASHSDPSGGIPLSVGGQPVLAEHGEAWDIDEFGGVAIINKRSTSAKWRELEQVRGRIFPGKRQYLSSINSHRNYGVSFAAEGAILQPEVASVITSQPSASSGKIVTVLDDASVNRVAAATARAVEVGSERGVSKGMNNETKRAQREARLSRRTGI